MKGRLLDGIRGKGSTLSTDVTPSEKKADTHRPDRPHLVRLVIVAVMLTGVIVALMVGIPWLSVVIPRWLIRKASIAFLWTLLAVYPMAVPAILVGGLRSSLAVVSAWRRRDRPALALPLRRVLLASSCLAGLIAMELTSAMVVRHSYRIPDLPTRFATSRDRPASDSGPVHSAAVEPSSSVIPGSEPPEDDGLYLVVIGESSPGANPTIPGSRSDRSLAGSSSASFPGERSAWTFAPREGSAWSRRCSSSMT